MIDIKGKTQIEIEDMASRKNLMLDLEYEVAIFAEIIEDIDLDIISDIIGEEYSNDILLELIYIVYVRNSKSRYIGDSRYLAYIATEDVITRLAGSKTLSDIYQLDIARKFRKSAEIVISMESILYEIEIHSYINSDNQKIDETVCMMSQHIDENEDYIPEWQYFRLPLIEKPIEWNENTNSGGYYSVMSSPTLNLGESDQPQNCLDVLNTLQANAYTLLSHVNPDDYYDFKMGKAKQKDTVSDEEEIHHKVVNTLSSYEDTIDTMKDYSKVFYFQWKFDFRGRAYSTGYNINLQGDKYQKGMLSPASTNFTKGK